MLASEFEDNSTPAQNLLVPKPPINDTNRIQHYGMLDSGTTDHFMSVSATVNNVRPTTNKLDIIIPDGSKMQSTHKCDIDRPFLPAQAQTAHIIPQLSNQSLLLVVKLCDAGCKVVF